MEPTITAGETILVNRVSYWFFNPKKNDIIAFHDPRDGKILIKRITKKNRTAYFVLGDNKNSSTDSRVFGMIEKSAIVGKVWLS
jgi:signal peptidase I